MFKREDYFQSSGPEKKIENNNPIKKKAMCRNSWFVLLIRPIAWTVFLLPIAGGFYLGASKGTSLVSVASGWGSLIFVLCFGFSVNAIGDVDVDRFHDGRSKDIVLSEQPLVTQKVSLLKVKLLSFLFLVGSLLCSLLVGLVFILCILALDCIAFVYSLEPFRMKKRPFGDILCNALLGEFFFLGGMAIGKILWNPLLLLIVLLIASNFYIPTVMTDYEFDKKAGLRTSAVVYGGQRLIDAMYFLTAAICITGVILVLSASFEVQVITLLMTVYTPIFTVIVKRRFKDNRLMLHQNWILVPFGCLTLVFFCLGALKIFF